MSKLHFDERMSVVASHPDQGARKKPRVDSDEQLLGPEMALPVRLHPVGVEVMTDVQSQPEPLHDSMDASVGGSTDTSVHLCDSNPHSGSPTNSQCTLILTKVQELLAIGAVSYGHPWGLDIRSWADLPPHVLHSNEKCFVRARALTARSIIQ